MKFNDFESFRQLDQRYVKIKNLSKELLKEINENNYKYVLYGIFYIDHNLGISLRIVKQIEEGKFEIIERIGPEYINDEDFTFFEGTDFLKDILDKEINSKDYTDSLKELREDVTLDYFRHPFFVDDILAYLYTDGKLERLFVRLEKKEHGSNGIYMGRLRSKSEFDSSYNVDTNVMVEYHKDNLSEAMIIKHER